MTESTGTDGNGMGLGGEGGGDDLGGPETVGEAIEVAMEEQGPEDAGAAGVTSGNVDASDAADHG